MVTGKEVQTNGVLPRIQRHTFKALMKTLSLTLALAGHGDYKTPEQGIPITRPDGRLGILYNH